MKIKGFDISDHCAGVYYCFEKWNKCEYILKEYYECYHLECIDIVKGCDVIMSSPVSLSSCE